MLDTFCRTHDIENLFVVDASFFPSSAAVNPGLTIAAQALRVADHIRAEHLTLEGDWSTGDGTRRCICRIAIGNQNSQLQFSRSVP